MVMSMVAKVNQDINFKAKKLDIDAESVFNGPKTGLEDLQAKILSRIKIPQVSKDSNSNTRAHEIREILKASMKNIKQRISGEIK